MRYVAVAAAPLAGQLAASVAYHAYHTYHYHKHLRRGARACVRVSVACAMRAMRSRVHILIIIMIHNILTATL